MFSVLCAAVYGIMEKHFTAKVLVILFYYLAVALIWAAVMFVVFLISIGKDLMTGRADPGFLWIVPLVGFGLVLIFAFFPWLTGLRNSKENT